MAFKFIIFEESNKGPVHLQEEINDFFNERQIKNIIHINTVVEKVEGIDYKSVVICYECED